MSVTMLKLHIGLSGFDFSTRIVSKYTLFRKSTNLPALIFRRLFGISMINKITNIKHIESINNYQRLHLNLYFKVLSVVSPTLLYSIIARRDTSPPSLTLLLKGGGQGGGGISNPSLPSLLKGGKRELQFLSSFARQRLMNIQTGKILNTQKKNKSVLNVKTNSFIFPEGISANFSLREINNSIFHFLADVIRRLTPKAFGAAATSDYTAPYVIQDKRMLSEIQLLTQSTQNLQNVIKSSETSSTVTAMERSTRNNLSVSEQTQQSPHFHISNPTPPLFLKGSPSLVAYPVPGSNYRNQNYIKQKALSDLKDSINDMVNKSTELTLRKPIIQSIDIALKNKDNLLTKKTISSKISNNLIKDSFKERSAHEINMIADKVYKILEKRIAIEKDRRGLH